MFDVATIPPLVPPSSYHLAFPIFSSIRKSLMAGTRASTRQAATTAANSDGNSSRRSTPALNGKTITRGRKGKALQAAKVVASSRQKPRSTAQSATSSRATSRSRSTGLTQEDVRKYNEFKKLEKKKALAAQAKADEGAYFINMLFIHLMCVGKIPIT